MPKQKGRRADDVWVAVQKLHMRAHHAIPNRREGGGVKSSRICSGRWFGIHPGSAPVTGCQTRGYCNLVCRKMQLSMKVAANLANRTSPAHGCHNAEIGPPICEKEHKGSRLARSNPKKHQEGSRLQHNHRVPQCAYPRKLNNNAELQERPSHRLVETACFRAVESHDHA